MKKSKYLISCLDSAAIALSFILFIGDTTGSAMNTMTTPANTQVDRQLQITLHPPKEFHQMFDQMRTGIPFHQTVPLAEGAFNAGSGDYTLSIAGEPTSAFISPARYWPDGSVRMLHVHALWPPNQRMGSAIPATIEHVGQQQKPVAFTAVEILDERTIRFTPAHQPIWQMQIHATAIPLLRDKRVEQTTDPEYWDAKGQYHWAQALKDVSDSERLIELSPVIRNHTVLKETPLYREYLIEGIGGDDSPGSELEWQMWIREYKGTSLFEVTMTWKVFWDPERYALAEASARFTGSESVKQVLIPGLDMAESLKDTEFLLYAQPNADYRVLRDNRLIHEAEGLDARADAWTMQVGDSWLGLALPRMTRLGPNHVRVGARQVEIAFWSPYQHAVLDLRRTTQPDEIGLSDVDFRDNAAGLAFSRRFTLTFSDHQQEVQNITKVYADYGQYWFASRDEYIATQALGPWREHVLDEYAVYLQGLRANIHFLLSSRHQWRWTGLINYGDMRTNFAIEERPSYGYYPGRWTSYGRFGWRNGSSQPYLGFLEAGLLLGDRQMMLAALDYVFHVADVDMRQPRTYGELLPYTGGFHRRNKDHWSGSIQVQYTPSSGLYLAYWLTDERRLAQATEAICGFMEREAGGSIYAASAWINRYQQTHEERDLRCAERLFQLSVRVAEQRHPDLGFDGPQLLYYDSFRRTLDSYPVLIDFFESTGDKQYLDHMLASIRRHNLPNSYTISLDMHIGPAYLLANGYSPQEIGPELIDFLIKELESAMPTKLPSYTVDQYDALMTIATHHLPPKGDGTYLLSNHIGRRARNTPTVLSWFAVNGARRSQQGAESDVDRSEKKQNK